MSVTGESVSPPKKPVAPRATVIRADIQALRAIAVLAVLFYHLWPNRIPGGYVGVDVFFVISGYLITAHLLSKPPRSVVDLLQFWGRRIRRLLPASLLVLLVTLIGSRLFAPATLWEGTAAHIRAAALYFVNWRLAADSVDYLARDAAATPVEHFWSLSVEEQFYLVWPVLIAVALVVATWLRRRAVGVVTAALALVVIASFAYSVHLTDTSPSTAYFVTPTRMWELGLGGLLAALLARTALGRERATDAVPLPPPARTALTWAGLAAIGWTVLTYSGLTPFPGWRAALPVLGAVAVIAAHAQRGRLSPSRLMATRPVQWLGDASYSIYLWHWPLIVLLPSVTGHGLGPRSKIGIIVVSLLLAGMTKIWVEDRFRTPKWGKPLWKGYVLGACLMAIVAGGATVQLRAVAHMEASSAASADAVTLGDCVGAAAIAPGNSCPQDEPQQLLEDPVAAKKDRPAVYQRDCRVGPPFTDHKTCTFGSGPVRVALIGNSHASHWLPALQEVGEKLGWTVTTYLISSCVPSFARLHFKTAADSPGCYDWGQWALGQITAGNFDLIVTSNRVERSDVTADFDGAGGAAYRDGFRQYMAALSAAAPIVVIKDIPGPGFNVPDCLAAHPKNLQACDGTPKKWRWHEPFIKAVAGLPGVDVIDMTKYFCTAKRCPAVIGGLPVYVDGHHMTASYAKTLGPYLLAALADAGIR